MSKKLDEPRISVAMMVKDEEEFLGDALQSTCGWADEVIVVDTGSSDTTVKIAEAFGAVVSHFAWCDDFSAARNETLRRATGDWIIVLDADERLAGPAPKALRERLRSLPTGYPFHVLMIDVVNTSLDGQVLSTLSSARVIPNDRRLGYTARVHNVFGSLDAKYPEIRGIPFDGLHLLHLGYDPEVYRRRKKAERSLPLIEAAVSDDPANLLHRYYLGREYYSLGRFDEAIGVLEETIERLTTAESIEQDVLLDAYWHLIEALRRAKAPLERTLAIAMPAVERFERSADLWYATACALIDAERWSESIRFLQHSLRCLDDTDGPPTRVDHMGRRRWEVLQRLGDASAELGDLEDAYAAYVTAIEHKPPQSAGWPALLNVAIALAIDLHDTERLDGLVERLLQQPDAPLDMFWLYLERVHALLGNDAARGAMDGAAQLNPCLVDAPQWSAWRDRL